MANEKRPSSLYMDLKNLRERFNEIDKEEKGYIEREGLEQMIRGMEGFDVSMTTELMESLDRDKDGKVTFEDFQTLFTLERDAVKNQQSSVNDYTSSPSSSAYVTATISPSAGTFPESPDLSAHVRSLPGTVFEFPPLDSHRLSFGEQGDIVLEDTGEYRDPGSPERFPQLTGYDLVRHELEVLCPMGVVEREDVEQLCKTLEMDVQDEKELLNIWEELHQLKPNLVTVEEMCHSFISNSVAMVTSTPATNTEVIRDGWQEPRHKVSFGSTPVKQLELPDNESIGKKQLAEEIDFPIPSVSHSVRPRSASTSLRFTRGYSETSLLHPYVDLQAQIGQLTQENTSLKANISRIEEDKRRLIEEGEDSIEMVQKQYEHKLKKMQDAHITKIREMEKSYTNERQTMQERTERRVNALEDQLKALKAEDEVLREDLKYYQRDNEKMVEQLQNLHNELDEKDDRIAKLCKAFGLQSETISETDLINSTSRIQELENELQVYMIHNDDLLKQNRELSDRVDELKAEAEQYKQRIIAEKRRRERHKSATTPPKHSHSRRRRSSADAKKKHNRPPVLATPIMTRKTEDGTESEGMEMDHVATAKSEDVIELESKSESSGDDDVFDREDIDGNSEDKAQSTVSLSEEIIREERNIGISQTISRLESKRTLLEESCSELENKICTLKSSEATLKKELENELQQRIQKRAKLDRDLDMLRQAFTNTLITIDGLKDDIADENDRELTRTFELSDENAELRAKVIEKEATIIDQLSQLKDYEERDAVKEEHLTRLQAELDQKIVEKEELVSRHSKELADLTMELSMKDASDLTHDLQQENLSLKEIKQELQDKSLSLEIQVLDLQGSLADLKDSDAMKNRAITQLEEKVEGQERELRMKKGEIGIAIFDLSQKEEECLLLQEKVQKLEKELTRLHLSHDEHLDQRDAEIKDLKTKLANSKLQLDEQKEILSQKQIEIDNARKEIELKQQELTDALNQVISYEKQLTALHDDTAPIASPTPSPKEPFVSDGLEQSLALSPNQSLNSSSGQTEIVSQMKTQLQDLQRILLNKSGEEDVDSELSVVQELLTINTSLEEAMVKQQQWCETEVRTRDSVINHLQNQLANADRPVLTHIAGISADTLQRIIEKALQDFSEIFKATPQLVQNLTDRITHLMWEMNGIQVALDDQISQHKACMDDLSLDLDSTRATVGSYHSEMSLLSAGLRQSKNKLNKSQEEMAKLEISKDKEILDLKAEIKQLESDFQKAQLKSEHQIRTVLEEKEKTHRDDSNIIRRLKNELKLLNHYFGKSKISQQQSELENDRALERKNEELMSSSKKIEKLEQEVMKWRSLPDLDLDTDLEASTQENDSQQKQDSLNTVISAMKEQLKGLYRDLVYPSDSTEVEELDYSELVDCIKEEIQKLKSEFSNEIIMREEGESKLQNQKEAYEALYIEHDEEVQALKQQNEQLQLKFSNAEDRFQHLVATQEMQVQQFQENEKQSLGKCADLEQSLKKCDQDYERAKESIQELENQKIALISLIEELSLQTVRALSSIT